MTNKYREVFIQTLRGKQKHTYINIYIHIHTLQLYKNYKFETKFSRKYKAIKLVVLFGIFIMSKFFSNYN